MPPLLWRHGGQSPSGTEETGNHVSELINKRFILNNPYACRREANLGGLAISVEPAPKNRGATASAILFD